MKSKLFSGTYRSEAWYC